jgi:hypothetical protein
MAELNGYDRVQMAHKLKRLIIGPLTDSLATPAREQGEISQAQRDLGTTVTSPSIFIIKQFNTALINFVILSIATS